eukprot:5928108-Prymnesium_polylepis.2
MGGESKNASGRRRSECRGATDLSSSDCLVPCNGIAEHAGLAAGLSARARQLHSKPFGCAPICHGCCGTVQVGQQPALTTAVAPPKDLLGGRRRWRVKRCSFRIAQLGLEQEPWCVARDGMDASGVTPADEKAVQDDLEQRLWMPEHAHGDSVCHPREPPLVIGADISLRGVMACKVFGELGDK